MNEEQLLEQFLRERFSEMPVTHEFKEAIRHTLEFRLYVFYKEIDKLAIAVKKLRFWHI